MEIIGLSEEKIKEISKIKGEDDWVLNYRLKGYNSFIFVIHISSCFVFL